MKVFLTGAAGFIGSFLVPELIDAGHHVMGLSRSDAGAEALTRARAEVICGDVNDLDSLRDYGVASRNLAEQTRETRKPNGCAFRNARSRRGETTMIAPFQIPWDPDGLADLKHRLGTARWGDAKEQQADFMKKAALLAPQYQTELLPP
jgi:uncharacterized protein YbjT (DUF2867 family)